MWRDYANILKIVLSVNLMQRSLFKSLSLLFPLIVLLLQSEDVVAQASNTGSITVISKPSSAKVYLNGRYIGQTPLLNESLPTGLYEVELSLDGHAGYKTKVDIIQNQNTEVHAQLSREIYLMWREQYSMAITSSILLPGKGQVDNGHERGWYYFLGYAAASAFAYYSSYSYHKALDNYDNAYAAYKAERNPEKTWEMYRTLLYERDNMTKHKANYETTLIIVGGIWALNMLDVIFFTVRRPVVYDESNRILSIYTRLSSGQIGILVKFP